VDGAGVTGSPIEPSADLRTFASWMRQTYVALTLEGFTEREALVIIGQLLAANRPQQ
jgi:hypothetical protein